MRTQQKKAHYQGKQSPQRDDLNIFVDWLKIRAHNSGRWPEKNSGHLMRVDEHGEIEYLVHTHIKAEGSHDSSAQIRVTREELELSFNPSRFNREENLFGCTYEQALQVANELLHSLGLKELQDFDITRLDVTQNLSTGSSGQLDAYIRHLKHIKMPKKTTYTKYDAAIFQNKQVKITVYKKADEIRVHSKDIENPQTLEYRLKVADYCESEGVSRVEVRFNRKALINRGIRKSKHVNQERLVEAFKKELSPMPKKTNEVIAEQLTDGETGSLLQWKAGFDPREKISKNTFYARRREILRKTGYDIAGEMPTRFDSKKVTVQTWPTEIPPWYMSPFKDDEDPNQRKLELVEE